jgi:ABC-type cobalamin/Fe3+-siderophores transport system ATPase subunit
MMSKSIITVRDLALTLNGFSLEVEHLELYENEKTVIIGPNGSGKTTFSKVLSGYLIPDSGTVLYNGVEIAKIAPKKRARIVNYGSFGQPQADLEKRVFDYIMLGTYSRDEEELELKKEVNELLSILDLKNFENREVSKLSSGEFQRVLLAQTLIQKAKVTILDEPLSHLDFSWQRRILNIIFEYSEKNGLTTISVIHDLNIALNTFERLIAFNNGRVICSSRIDSISDKINTVKALETAYETDLNYLIMGDVVFVLPF